MRKEIQFDRMFVQKEMMSFKRNHKNPLPDDFVELACRITRHHKTKKHLELAEHLMMSIDNIVIDDFIRFLR